MAEIAPLPLDLSGLRVVLTAGGAGLGRATARVLADRGAHVWVCDIDEPSLAEATEHPRIDGVVADVGATASIDRFMTTAIAALGGIDVLVNNAGVAGPGGPVESLDPEDVTRTLDIDVVSMFRTARHAIGPMKAQGTGSIINISSTAGLSGFPNRAAYAAAKFAVIGLTETMAMELGEFGIRVNAVCPGSLHGPRMEHVIALEVAATGRSRDDVAAAFERQVSMRSFVDAEDVAHTIAFLASPFAAKISGQALAVDGNTETLRA